jgi:probable rRNA maturation factor
MTTATRVDVQLASTHDRIPSADAVRCWAEAALDDVGAPPGTICIRIVDEAESAALNMAYREKSAPTNVLSFPAHLIDPETELPLLGDIAVCAPVVAREAIEQGKSLDDHWAHLVVHGVLHVMGYDHEHPEDADRMETRETEILGRLGVADPYAA